MHTVKYAMRPSFPYALLQVLLAILSVLVFTDCGQAAQQKLATGRGHGAWLKADGTVWTWGSNRYGQLGFTGEDAEKPRWVDGLADVRDVACADDSTYALLADGKLMAFGSNEYGQLGNGGVTPGQRPEPVPGLERVTAVTAAHRSVLALQDDGTVWQWGDDSNGSRPRMVANLSGVVAVSYAEGHGAALTKDGSVWVWGNYHGAGDLGNGCYGCADEPIRLPELSDVAAIAAGYQLTVALKKDGTVWTVGYGEAGQLGDGTRRSAGKPVKVKGLEGVSAVAAGWMHVLALKKDGTLWAWGDNHYGELGNPVFDLNSVDNHATPVRCGKLTGVTAAAAASKHSLALTEKGMLFGFGENEAGVLTGDTENLSQADSPMEIGREVPEECQQILFGCQCASGKYVQICGKPSSNGSEQWSDIQYRFGPPRGVPELLFPREPVNPPPFFFSHAVLRGDYLVTVRFISGGFTYRVFSGSKSGAGVAVENAKGKRLATVKCIERPELYASYLWRSLPCDTLNPYGNDACREKPPIVK